MAPKRGSRHFAGRKDIEDCDDLNRLIDEWEGRIAEACGKKAFHGHGNYSVSAASEMGLNLSAKVVDDDTQADGETVG